MLRFSIMHSAREWHPLHRHGRQLPRNWRDWELPEETMPQSTGHAAAVKLMEAILDWWARSQPNTRVAHDLGIRWVEQYPNVGLDPDVSVFRPAPPTKPNGNLLTVRTWVPGHTLPILAIEVVSETNPRKDYEIVPKKYEASGTPELCIFDPFLAGPRGDDGRGPYRLQLWLRNEYGELKRVYAGDGPVYSPTLNGYFMTVDEGRKLRISSDEAGLQWWPTSDEVAWEAEAMERVAKEAERKAKEAAQKAEKEALARVAELEAQLAQTAKATKKK